MNYPELKKVLDSNENEHLEFKEARNSFSVLGGEKHNKYSVYGYTVGFSNEGGGKLILGVNDNREIVGTSAFENFSDIKSKIFVHTKLRITITEIITPTQKRVLVIEIPPRPTGEVIRFYGIPLMRVGQELLEMDNITERDILNEMKIDFSAQICSGITIDDLDPTALEKMKFLYSKKTGRSDINEKQLLRDLRLVDAKGVTYAALILLGKAESIRQNLDNNEIIFQYRGDKNLVGYQDRVAYKKAFLLIEDALWGKINSRNIITQLAEGFLTREIMSFNEEVVKEAVLNAITHRDYADPGSIIICQSPSEIVIQNPGGFVKGVNAENIITQTKPRNRRIAEVLQHLGFVQRAGQGVDLIYRRTIEEGKGLPDYSQSDDCQVMLVIPAVVKDKKFIKYLENVINEKQISFSIDELVRLEKIKDGFDKFFKKDIKKFLDMGIVEQTGLTSGAKYHLSYKYYLDHKQSGLHTRVVGLSREVKKKLIIEHLKRNNAGGTLTDFALAFPDMKRKDISNILQELKGAKTIKSYGKTRGGIWKLIR